MLASTDRCESLRVTQSGRNARSSTAHPRNFLFVVTTVKSSRDDLRGKQFQTVIQANSMADTKPCSKRSLRMPFRETAASCAQLKTPSLLQWMQPRVKRSLQCLCSRDIETKAS